MPNINIKDLVSLITAVSTSIQICIHELYVYTVIRIQVNVFVFVQI